MENEVRLIDEEVLYGMLEWDNDIERYTLRGLEFGDEIPTIDPESLRPKGHWNIRCDYYVDSITREVDENFYLECSECKRKVWDINQMAAMNGEYRKLIEQYPYCHCGAKMEG